MIALGGVIGAGLFVGSGVVIKSAGPAAVLSFVITGLLVVLVMRMLGEMAVAIPAVGSFYEYARLAWRDRPRLGGSGRASSRGWMYWYFWVIVVALEAVAGAGLVRFWLPAGARLARQSGVAGAAYRHQPALGRGPTASSSSGSPRSRSPRSSRSCWSAGLFVLGLWPGTAPAFGRISRPTAASRPTACSRS